MLKLCRVTKIKVLFLVLVCVFNFNFFEFSAAILEKGLFHCLLSLVKPRPHERFFGRAGDAIFSNFVASPAREGGYTSDKF